MICGVSAAATFNFPPVIFNSSLFHYCTTSSSFLSNSLHGMWSWHWTPCSWVSVDSTLSKDNMGKRFPLTGRQRPCWGILPDGEQTKMSLLRCIPGFIAHHSVRIYRYRYGLEKCWRKCTDQCKHRMPSWCPSVPSNVKRFLHLNIPRD